MKDIDKLKKVFFQDDSTFFGKKSVVCDKTYIKGITSIFSNIANMPQYAEIRKRYRVHKAVEKILLSHHLGYIVYITYRGDKLIIMAKNHIAQVELNYQKMVLIKYLKQIKEFENIKTVSILRWDKEILKHNYIDTDSEEYNTEDHEDSHFNERSYGIFENMISDKRLSQLVEDIRKLIVLKI